MREPLACRELLGHADHPELLLEGGETSFTTLADPLPFHYIVLADKHLDEQMHPARLVGLAPRRAVVETSGDLTRHANIMLQLEVESQPGQPEEVYAKVVQPLDAASRRYVIHFTSIPPAIRAWFHRLLNPLKSP